MSTIRSNKKSTRNEALKEEIRDRDRHLFTKNERLCAMSAHGPEAAVFEKASRAELGPVRMQDNLAFMFESTYAMKLTSFAATSCVDEDYQKCWTGFKKFFDPTDPNPMYGEDILTTANKFFPNSIKRCLEQCLCHRHFVKTERKK